MDEAQTQTASRLTSLRREERITMKSTPEQFLGSLNVQLIASPRHKIILRCRLWHLSLLLEPHSCRDDPKRMRGL